MVTRDFVQAGKFWDKNGSKALFGDPQEVHLVAEYIRPNIYFFAPIVIGRHYHKSGLGGHDFPHCSV